jgi:parallel beta-helix repeat protein
MSSIRCIGTKLNKKTNVSGINQIAGYLNGISIDILITIHKITVSLKYEVSCMRYSLSKVIPIVSILVIIAVQNFQPPSIFGFSDSLNCIDYNAKLNMLTIYCNSNIPSIYNSINNTHILDRESAGVWILNSTIDVSPNATLHITSGDTSWLKILSNSNNPNFIYIRGSVDIDKVKITSWDFDSNSPIYQNSNGSVPRPYIMIEESDGTLNISNSEVGYLGFNNYPSNGFLYANGGSGSVLENNTFHDMWDGFYSDGVGYLTIKNNTYFNNLRYGIDPHTGSHDLRVTNNTVFNNTRIGIICALNCYNILFANNTVHNNGVAGIMFAENNTNSTASGNHAYNEEVAMSVFASTNNTLHNNRLSFSKIGIFLGGNSSNNNIYENTIDNDRYGFYITDLTFHNLLKSNDMTNVITGIRIPNDNYTYEVDEKPVILGLK